MQFCLKQVELEEEKKKKKYWNLENEEIKTNRQRENILKIVFKQENRYQLSYCAPKMAIRNCVNIYSSNIY